MASHRMSRKTKAGFQIAATSVLFGGAFLYSQVVGVSNLRGVETPRRNLNSTVDCGTFSLSEVLDISGSTKPLCDGYDAYLLLAVFLMIYMFWALAIVVDEYFIPNLEYFQEYWDISPDVAGATLMAAGGSAPEFFTNLFSSLTLSATGFGTIVGSAVFNILFVIAAVAYFSREVLKLEWWIVFRDSTYYTLTILVLAFFFFCGNLSDTYECQNDGVMLAYECAILFVMYIVYCAVLFTCHESLRDWIEMKMPCIVPKEQRRFDLGEEITPVDTFERRPSIKSLKEGDESIALRPKGPCPEDPDEMSEPKKIIRFIIWMISVPIVGICMLVPRADSPFWEEGRGQPYRIFGALFGFVLSLVWIGGFTWLMVFSAETFGKSIGIPDVVMGYTFLAAGTSAPDLLSSVFVALKGHGGMAVSSSIGSNIFDITVGLPIPWLISTSIGNTVIITAESIFVSLATLLAMLVLVIAIIIQQGWRLTNTLAVVMMVFYFIFLIIVLIPEFT